MIALFHKEGENASILSV